MSEYYVDLESLTIEANSEEEARKKALDIILGDDFEAVIVNVEKV